MHTYRIWIKISIHLLLFDEWKTDECIDILCRYQRMNKTCVWYWWMFLRNGVRIIYIYMREAKGKLVCISNANALLPWAKWRPRRALPPTLSRIRILFIHVCMYMFHKSIAFEATHATQIHVIYTIVILSK